MTPLSPFGRPRAPRCALAAFVMACSLLDTISANASDESVVPIGEDWLARMEAPFHADPSLRAVRGSGWKPLQRIRFFRERLLGEGGAPAGEAWQRAIDETARQRSEASALMAADWFVLGPRELSGRILDLAFGQSAGGSVIYAASASGGLWVGSPNTLESVGWLPRTDELGSLAIGSVAADYSLPNVVVIATGEANGNAQYADGIGILRSTDVGATWNQTNVTFPRGTGYGFYFVRAFEQAPGVYLAGGRNNVIGDGFLYRSTDSGATWVEDPSVPGTPFDAVEADPSGSDGGPWILVAAGDPFTGGTQVYRSSDLGASWVTPTPLPAASARTRLATCSGNDNKVYAHVAGGNVDFYQTLGVYRSDDAGASFQLRNDTQNFAQTQGWYDLAVGCVPGLESEVVYVGGVRNWSSTDGGLTFEESGTDPDVPLGDAVTLHVDQHALVYYPGDQSMWVANDGGVWRGPAWLRQNKNLATYQFYDICLDQTDPVYLFGGTQDNGVPRRYEPFSPGWYESAPGFGDGGVCNIDPTDGNVAYAESQFGAHRRSTDGGDTWEAIGADINGQGRWIAPVDIDPTNSAVVYTETFDGIQKSTNGGVSFTNVSPHRAAWIAVNSQLANSVWTVEAGFAPYVSTDAGTNWAQVAPYGFAVSGPATRILPYGSATVLVTFAGFAAGARVVRSTDTGTTWDDVSGDLPVVPIHCIARHPLPGHWYIGTETGVWSTTDSGLDWEPMTGIPAVRVMDLELRQSTAKLVAGTYGRGVWETALPSLTDATVVAGVPPGLMLDPPLPNPASRLVQFRFAAKGEEPLELAVYDVAGRRVASIAREERGLGFVRTATWVPNDVAAGTYFVVLTAGDGRLSRKVAIVR